MPVVYLQFIDEFVKVLAGRVSATRDPDWHKVVTYSNRALRSLWKKTLQGEILRMKL